MSEFSELIKNFDKIRDYMRDFYVYGFKSRDDYTQKSARTYDNERRRIENYLGQYISWETDRNGKRVFISVDSAQIAQNPLYAAWKSKSFTNNDITLHFYILDILTKLRTEYNQKVATDGQPFAGIGIMELADLVSESSSLCVDVQTIRIKVKEYVKEGILLQQKKGNAMYYRLSDRYFHKLYCNMEMDEVGCGCEALSDAIGFFREAAPFGIVGSYILDNEQQNSEIFRFKHHFIVHTLEDQVLLEILEAMNEKRRIRFVNQSTRLGKTMIFEGVPMRIFSSGQSGRRYIAICELQPKRFSCYRLDYIKKVEQLEPYQDFEALMQEVDRNLDKCWGVSFGGSAHAQQFSMVLQIDEQKEMFIVKRLMREGKGGRVERIEQNVFQYTIEIFDTNEIMTWVKSFTGRILRIECKDKSVMERFHQDMWRMHEMYCIDQEV